MSYPYLINEKPPENKYGIPYNFSKIGHFRVLLCLCFNKCETQLRIEISAVQSTVLIGIQSSRLIERQIETK